MLMDCKLTGSLVTHLALHMANIRKPSTVASGRHFTGCTFVLLNMWHAAQVSPSQAMLVSGQEAVEVWRPLAHHPGLLCPRAAFVSDEVGGRPALFFVHDHMPGQQCRAIRSCWIFTHRAHAACPL